MIHYNWDPYLYDFINLGGGKFLQKKSKIPMIYGSFAFFRNGSILQYVFEKKCSELSELFRIVQIDPFIGELPNEIRRGKICTGLVYRIS